MPLAPVRVAAGLLTALAALTVAVLAVDPLPGETDLLRAARVDPDATGRWQALSDATDLLPVALLAGGASLLLFAAGRRAAALLVVAAPLGAALANGLVKALVRRDRPELMLSTDASVFAFPSGHAAHSTAVVAAMAVVLLSVLGRRGAAVTVVLAAAAAALGLVAATQLALARHYPSDLLAGALLGAAWVALLVAAGDRLRRRAQPRDGQA